MRAIDLKRFVTIAGLLLVLTANLRSADKETIVWKSIPNAILQVDSKAPKEWNVFQPGKNSIHCWCSSAPAISSSMCTTWKSTK